MAKVTSQDAEGILVEGRHPLSVVFHGLEKPLKLRFVAVNSICEALNHGDAFLGGIVGHLKSRTKSLNALHLLSSSHALTGCSNQDPGSAAVVETTANWHR